eukprot:6325203-Alexandrium_andersonii.AAC.1
MQRVPGVCGSALPITTDRHAGQALQVVALACVNLLFWLFPWPLRVSVNDTMGGRLLPWVPFADTRDVGSRRLVSLTVPILASHGFVSHSLFACGGV